MATLTFTDLAAIFGASLVFLFGWGLVEYLQEPGTHARLRAWLAAVRDRYVIVGGTEDSDETAAEADESAARSNEETDENRVATGETERNGLLPFPDGFAVLATLVNQGRLNQGEALALMGVKPGSSARYKAARDRLQRALDGRPSVERPMPEFSQTGPSSWERRA